VCNGKDGGELQSLHFTALLTAPLLAHSSAPLDHNSKQGESTISTLPTLSKASPLGRFLEEGQRTLKRETHTYTINTGEQEETVKVSVTGLVEEWEEKKGLTFNEDEVIEGEIVEWVVE
jgi:hypothetical protein